MFNVDLVIYKSLYYGGVMQQRHNIEVVQGGLRREEYANRNECCATDLCSPAQSGSGTSAPKPVSATTAAKGSAGSSTFTVLLTMACCFATFFSQEMKQR